MVGLFLPLNRSFRPFSSIEPETMAGIGIFALQ
jgi:hypothetical protein